MSDKINNIELKCVEADAGSNGNDHRELLTWRKFQQLSMTSTLMPRTSYWNKFEKLLKALKQENHLELIII